MIKCHRLHQFTFICLFILAFMSFNFICFGDAYEEFSKSEGFRTKEFAQSEYSKQGVCLTVCLCMRSFLLSVLNIEEDKTLSANKLYKIVLNVTHMNIMIDLFTENKAKIIDTHQQCQYYTSLVANDAERIPNFARAVNEKLSEAIEVISKCLKLNPANNVSKATVFIVEDPHTEWESRRNQLQESFFNDNDTKQFYVFSFCKNMELDPSWIEDDTDEQVLMKFTGVAHSTLLFIGRETVFVYDPNFGFFTFNNKNVSLYLDWIFEVYELNDAKNFAIFVHTLQEGSAE
jgi:hypothetical protein